MPAETRIITFREDMYLETDVDANDRVTVVRAFNESGFPARCRLTVTSGESAGRSTGWQVIPVNSDVPGTPTLEIPVPTGAAARLQLDWDATRNRYTNLDKEIEWPWTG